MDCVAIIPARYGSTRFPGKALATLSGRPVVAHVVEVCAAVDGLDAVIVATDDARIAEAARAAGAQAVLTPEDLASGTDRVAHVAADLGAEIVVNVQGDEPQLDPAELGAALARFRTSEAEIGTLRAPLKESRDLWDPNTVKVVVDAHGRALYFSRSPVPLPRKKLVESEPKAGQVALAADTEAVVKGPWWIHVGVYLYRTPALLRWARMPRSPLEIAEDLEQLRVLEAGERIETYQVAAALPGVDTPADLERVQQALDDRTTHDIEP